MSLIEASIFRAKKISLETLRQTKTAKNEKIIPFTFTYNPKNLKVFPKIKQNVDILKQCPMFFRGRNLPST